jgi:hypothetical protein
MGFERTAGLVVVAALIGWCHVACSSGTDTSDTAAPGDLSGRGDSPDVWVEMIWELRVDFLADEVLVDRYPRDDELRLNQLQCKGTHNSYHLLPDELASEEWDYEHAPLDVQLEEYGVRQVELDIHWHEEEGRFAVYHVPVLDDNSSCDDLVNCLQLIKTWSEENPAHQTLFVLIEPKDDLDLHTIEGHYGQLDSAILEVWPRELVVTPADVVGKYADMREALSEAGWPSLGETRGKALFHLLDSGHHRENYLGPDVTLQDRVMHVRGGPETPWGSFVEFGNAQGGEDQIATLAEASYIVRSTADSTDPADYDTNAARAAAALVASHVISTDFPAPTEDGSYYFNIPDGSPSRCHPATAPAWCTSADIEALP